MIKVFLAKTIGFLSIPALFLALVTLCVPPTPRVTSSLLFAKLDKDTLLRDTKPPRLILVGGSNLSFGIDSQMLKDALHVNPINTGIHANLGLKYMMDSTAPYIQPGDIVVLVPEYSQYFGDRAYGSEELLRMVVDVDRSHMGSLSLKQWANIIPYVPTVAFSKLRVSEYSFVPKKQAGVYERRSFNQYGDAYMHWKLKREPFDAYAPWTEPLNDAVIDDIVVFQQQVQARGGVLYISFPGFQDISYQHVSALTQLVEAKLRAQNFQILGTPERYAIPDAFMYNTPYHLLKPGVDLRTERLIEDLRNALR